MEGAAMNITHEFFAQIGSPDDPYAGFFMVGASDESEAIEDARKFFDTEILPALNRAAAGFLSFSSMRVMNVSPADDSQNTARSREGLLGGMLIGDRAGNQDLGEWATSVAGRHMAELDATNGHPHAAS
jgi:hypothetical protein